jgi:Rieske Fe-S protein
MTDPLTAAAQHAGGASPATAGVDDPASGPSRRRVLLSGGVVVAAVAVTAACGSGSQAGGGGAAAGGTVPTSDVPVGGGDILAAQKVVITQPTAGKFKAFTAVCTHQGCIVDKVANGVIECPCHGSQFSIEDGSVQAGPAPAPLAEVPIKVSGSTITLT